MKTVFHFEKTRKGFSFEVKRPRRKCLWKPLDKWLNRAMIFAVTTVFFPAWFGINIWSAVFPQSLTSYHSWLC